MTNRSLSSSCPRLGRLLLACFLAASALAGCGGGGGGDATPAAAAPGASTPASTPAPAPQPSVSLTTSAASVSAGKAVTLTWNAQDTGAANCTASGAWSGLLATSGSQQVTPAAAAGASATYTLACGAATGSVTVAVAPPVNTVPVTVDRGPKGANAFDIPFVSVTVCRPGTTVCQTIDHVMVDTGSYGLRLIAPVDPALALPAVTAASGAPVGECGQFVSGYVWGAIVQADVKLGGETARALSIQAVGQLPGAAPAACANLGADIGTVASLGANGILGVGLFKQDCGGACVARAVEATYYACSGASCVPTAMPLAKQVANPVSGFATDNNGVILAMPAVGAGGADGLTGTLTFGVGTQSNNALGGATVLAADASGNFTTVYKGTRLNASFIDSGSNGLFFNDASIPACTLSVGFYCPPRPLALSATMVSNNGATAQIGFTIENVDALPATVTAASVGGPNSSHHGSAGNSFDWGLPFFFGRRVVVGMEGASAPYWAF